MKKLINIALLLTLCGAASIYCSNNSQPAEKPARLQPSPFDKDYMWKQNWRPSLSHYTSSPTREAAESRFSSSSTQFSPLFYDTQITKKPSSTKLFGFALLTGSVASINAAIAIKMKSLNPRTRELGAINAFCLGIITCDSIHEGIKRRRLEKWHV